MIHALIIALALGQFGPGGMQPLSPRRHRAGVSAPIFRLTSTPAVGAYTTVTPDVGGAFSCSRTSSPANSATYQPTATTVASAADNTCRVGNSGLLFEKASENDIRDSAFGNALWSAATNSASMSEAFSQAGAPDGTSTVVKLTFNGTAGTTDYALWNDSVTTAAIASNSAYVHSQWTIVFPDATQVPMTVSDGVAVQLFHGRVAASASTWSRISVHGTSNTSGKLDVGVGPFSPNGDGAYGAFDAYVWGAQLEPGAFPTSLIYCAGSTHCTRTADIVDIGAKSIPATPAFTGDANLLGLPASGTAILWYATDGTHAWKLAHDTGGHATFCYDSTCATTAGSVSAGTKAKLAGYYDGALHACINGTCSATSLAAPGAMSATHVYLGGDGSGSNQLNGFTDGQLCIGSGTAVCAP
jgi:hypothetical protein